MANFSGELLPLSGFNKGITSIPAANAPDRLSNTITSVVTILTIFSGLAFLTWFVIGALTWISSANNAEKLEKAKNQMTNAIIGLIIVILAIPIISLLGKIVGLNILDPAAIIKNIVPN